MRTGDGRWGKGKAVIAMLWSTALRALMLVAVSQVCRVGSLGGLCGLRGLFERVVDGWTDS